MGGKGEIPEDVDWNLRGWQERCMNKKMKVGINHTERNDHQLSGVGLTLNLELGDDVGD